MERVQFQQEQMLDELKDLVEKGLFTAKETREIMKKRTAFETALVRRIAKKSDFLRYAAYEMGLEQLRRKRMERLKLPNSPPSVSDYALVRRQFHIFERALKKFKTDVGLWVQYVEVAKREGARALVGRITARAVQIHPNCPALYILAASHELNHLSPSAARTLLQRGIRLNEDSVDMWREYVRMELGFVESLRRRWDVLGIDVSDGGKGKAREMDMNMDQDENEKARDELTHMEADAGIDGPGDEGAAARKQIMDGVIIKSVMSSAVQAMPKIELFTSLKAVIIEYPSLPSLREALLVHLYSLLQSTLPGNPHAIKLLATRSLTPELQGEALIEALRRANEELLAAVSNGSEDIFGVYAEFVEEWCSTAIDINLKLYLITSLRSAIGRNNATKSSPSLLSAHIRLSTQYEQSEPVDSDKVMRTVRKYTSRAPTAAHVWLARLGAECRNGDRHMIDKVWREARTSVVGEDTDKVWMWGLAQFREDSIEDRIKTHQVLLKESMRDSSLSGVHELLLISYAAVIHAERVEFITTGRTTDQHSVAARAAQRVRHMAKAYLTTAKVWQTLFALESQTGWDSDAQYLQEVYEEWRKKDGLESAVGWAEWLMRNGKGKEAKEVVVRAKAWLGGEEQAQLEQRWTSILDHGLEG